MGVNVDRKQALKYYDRAAARGSTIAKQAAANLRSPDYDQRPPASTGGDWRYDVLTSGTCGIRVSDTAGSRTRRTRR